MRSHDGQHSGLLNSLKLRILFHIDHKIFFQENVVFSYDFLVSFWRNKSCHKWSRGSGQDELV